MLMESCYAGMTIQLSNMNQIIKKLLKALILVLYLYEIRYNGKSKFVIVKNKSSPPMKAMGGKS